MTEITQCPQCGTRFKVTGAQLDAHDGLVRCGRCHEVFDASKHLHDDEPNPQQLSLPIEPEIPAVEAEIPTIETDLAPIFDVPEPKEEPTTLAQQVQFVEELTDEILEMPPKKTSWTAVFAGFLLALILLAQATYYFRIEIGTSLPGLKPLLEDYCALLQCTVALPQKADLISIESSELESDPNLSNIVTLHALIHNRAPYAQAYPSLELTLTSVQDQPIARRVFHAADYLKAGDNEMQGLPANRDLDIKLHLDTTDLQPSGYRLFLFYPK
jgi:predicted Zn finger-like uncharacterized protein